MEYLSHKTHIYILNDNIRHRIMTNAEKHIFSCKVCNQIINNGDEIISHTGSRYGGVSLRHKVCPNSDIKCPRF
jgi:hypothetical protein